MNYCQDGLLVYFATETQQYTSEQIYGYYELQPNDVNGRPYFKMDSNGLWWDGKDSWTFGYVILVGQTIGMAYYTKDVFCPHQLSDWGWVLIEFGNQWYAAGNDLGITCK